MRNENQVHMIGHKTEAEQRRFVKLHVMPEKFEIDKSFAVGSKKELARVAALCDVVRNINDSDTGKTSYQWETISENVPSVPGFPRVSPRFPLQTPCCASASTFSLPPDP
jgi:hypothetical protein